MDYPAKIPLRNILYPTDFSRSSVAALPSARSLARAYGATLHALHVVVPDALTYMTPEYTREGFELQEREAAKQMRRLEQRLTDIPHTVNVTRSKDVGTAVESFVKDLEIDLIVVGTHGRSGLKRLLAGSGAEQILRRSGVPVMIVGPAHERTLSDGHFHRVVFPSDFTPQSLAAVPYAVSVAQENNAALTLLHVIKKEGREKRAPRDGISIAEALHRLHDIVPPEIECHSHTETLVEHGEPADRILGTAKNQNADLIVLGVSGRGGLFAATHLANTAHRVIARSACPVLTVCAPAA